MSCCGDPIADRCAGAGPLSADFAASLTKDGDTFRLPLYVPDIHCAACIGRIETAINAIDGVAGRVNFTRRTVTLTWSDPAFAPAEAIGALRDLGYAPQPLAATGKLDDPKGTELLRCLAVAAFAAMNVMLLSVSVWAGADGTTRAFLNWFAALIALPALVYAARPFFRSAVGAIRAFQLNMDVPIAIAIVLAAGLSLVKTIAGTGETYFDAAITLTFFLLAGRVLDHMARERARSSVNRLAAIRPASAHLRHADGRVELIPVESVEVGDVLEVAAGERVPVDARLVSDHATFDVSLATGESRPVDVEAEGDILAGSLAITGPIVLAAERPAAESFLSRLAALQAVAETSRSRPARLADRAAKVYAPVVHLAALATFLGWVLVGASPGDALTTAIAVLIITCPCALGLAVPAVHVAACDRLFRRGLIIKDGAALERLRNVDAVVFDKTGTLTLPELDPAAPVSDEMLAAAAALARHSTHPMSRAILRAAERRHLVRRPSVLAAGDAARMQTALPHVTGVVEHRGRGVSGRLGEERVFLGRGEAPWGGGAGDGFHLAFEGGRTVPLAVIETLREGAFALVSDLQSKGMTVSILSGDTAPAVARVAEALGIESWRAGLSPADKVAVLDAMSANGARVLMVGDGLNDGPALAAAHASIAPAEASDLSQTAADIVMTRDRLDDVTEALGTARAAYRRILENFAVAAGYNCIAVPLAVLGYASPLAAAIAMSTSSIVVIFNALRLLPRRTSPPEGAARVDAGARVDTPLTYAPTS
ncbi:heavy metal translocating P-type ATPase [Acuticoccus sp. M5D2P5]|uniref:heavy metal translocating P-type ATPase n=1 Tax=Acuticoccus kalidii TaxID=2910977 RepID=UPI001F385A7F|nr:heavy metal translocating P-type ATPase [Acuticoccus kalidii]MCF3934432.1 heavy metal translocating P-type ATPase [Acuticoccus kalidii]